MRKSLKVSMAVCILICFALAGCGTTSSKAPSASVPISSQTEQTSAAPKTTERGEPTVSIDSVGYPDAKIELTWLSQAAFDAPQKSVADYIKKCCIDFVKAHPEVKIRLTAQSVNIQDAMAKLIIQAAAGNAPDLACVDSFVLPSYKKYLQPVGDVLAENNISIDSWFPFAQEMMKSGDDIVAMWYDTDVRMLYYQKNLVKTPPKDWDELISIAEKLKKDGYVFLYPAGKNETTSCDIWPWFWAQGGQIVDDTGRPIFNEGANREYMLNTLKFLKKTIDTGITPTRVTSFMTDGDMNEDIAGGKVAMFVAGSWVASQLIEIMGRDTFLNTYAMANIPVIPGGQTKTTSGGWTLGVFTKDDTKRRLAAQFAIDGFIGDEGIVNYCIAKGNLPCRASVYDSAEHYKTDVLAQQFKEALKYGTVRPNVEIYNFISSEFQVAISDVITGISTPEAALDKMAKNVDAEYAKKSKK